MEIVFIFSSSHMYVCYVFMNFLCMCVCFLLFQNKCFVCVFKSDCFPGIIRVSDSSQDDWVKRAPIPLSWSYNWENHPQHLCKKKPQLRFRFLKTEKGCNPCCLKSQHPVTVRCPAARHHSILGSEGRDLLHLGLRMQAASSKVSKSLMHKSWVMESVGCVSACLTPPPGGLLPCPILFFLRHKHKMELAKSKNNLSKMAECSGECQAIKRRERAPPAVQQKDPIFFLHYFCTC